MKLREMTGHRPNIVHYSMYNENLTGNVPHGAMKVENIHPAIYTGGVQSEGIVFRTVKYSFHYGMSGEGSESI